MAKFVYFATLAVAICLPKKEILFLESSIILNTTSGFVRSILLRLRQVSANMFIKLVYSSSPIARPSPSILNINRLEEFAQNSELKVLTRSSTRVDWLKICMIPFTIMDLAQICLA